MNRSLRHKVTSYNFEESIFKFVFENNTKFIGKLQKYYGELLLTLYPDSSVFNICPACFLILSVHLCWNIYMYTYRHLKILTHL